MQPLIRKVFGIYSGEGILTFQFVRLAIFWAFGSSCLDILSDSLFLAKIGAEALPRVYLLSAGGLIAVSSLVLYSLRSMSPYRILTIAMALGMVLCIGAAFCVGSSPSDWFWVALKVASKMFLAMMVACSWTFTDQYHDLQDAKRIYAIYSGAYFLGTILSGIAINFFLDRVGFSGLLLGSALSILLAIFEARRIALKGKAVHDDTVEGVFSGTRDSALSVVQLIIRSPFTIVLLLLSLCLQLNVTVTEFNYMDAFSRAIAEDRIAEFLAKCRIFISLGNLCIGVFFYGRLIRKLGLNNVVLITPLLFFGIYSGWVFQDLRLFAILGVVAVDGIQIILQENGFNLLSNAVPSKLKSKVRIINDSFFEPIGMLLSAFLLLGFQEGSRGLGLTLALVTVIVAFVIRSTYSNAILINLKDNALHFERKLKGWIASMTRREQKEAKKDILDALNAGSEETQLLAIESLLELGDANVLPKILAAAGRFGTLSKIQFLKLIDAVPFAIEPRVIETIDSWSHDTQSTELLKWINFYLAKRGLHHPEKAEDDLDHPDLLYRSAAILTLKKSLLNQSLDYAALNRTIAHKKIDLMLKSGRIDEVSMGLDLMAEDGNVEAGERALAFLGSESILVKRAASRCVARVACKKFSRHAPRLIEELFEARDNAFRLNLLDALGKIADSTIAKDLLLASIHFRPNERRRTEEVLSQMGLKVVPLLITLTKDIALPERARILAGKALARLALPQLQANLIDILDIEIERAYFYFYFGHTIQKQYPLYDLSMLQSALLTGYQSVIDFIIHLLGATGSLEDPELLVRAPHSRNAKIHSHAVESLEKTCNMRIFKLIMPLVDDLPLEEKMAACLSWQGDYPKLTLSELLAKLEQSPSLFDKVVASSLKAKLQMPNWRQQLREQMKRSNETFHQFAYELLEK